MDIILEQYAERLRRKRRAPRTLQNFKHAATKLDAWLEAQGLSTATADFAAFEDYFDALDLAPTSKQTHLSYIKAAVSYGVQRGLLRENPIIDLDLERPQGGPKRIIPTNCLREIKARIICDFDWRLFHLLTYTGMRRNEIRSLLWDNVLLEDDTIHVVGKGSKFRLVPIHPALGEILAEGDPEPGRPVLPARGRIPAEQTLHDGVKRLSKVFTPHDYRRTVTTNLRRNGVATSVIDQIMGWAPESVRGRYYDHVAPLEMRQAILKLYADDPI